MNEAGFVSVLIPAVGGQGGGVLSEWIVEAAIADGYVAHGTSIPGVAQRTGSTTYYAEVFPARAGDAPTVSLYPVPGALDVLLAPELLEVGRMIELGFPSPSRTTIIASTHRLYSIHEKVAIGDALYPTERLLEGARAFSRRLHEFDALALAREHGTEVNAILLGALAGSAAMPMRDDAYREAIRAKGVQVDANLRGFELGLSLARYGGIAGAGARNGAPQAAAPAADDSRVAALPEAVRSVVRHALPRLIDYQDARYTDRYLGLLQPFLAGDADVAARVARYLALWMTYEDAIRVADLKTRAARFARIRSEAGAPGAVIEVVDYLKPDLDEMYGILPHALVAPFARWAERRWPHGRPTMAQHVRTTTVTGFLRVWLLGRLRGLRPSSYRAHEEFARIHRWLEAVQRCAAWDVALAREVAQAGQLVKGYGDVRRRMFAHLDRLLASALAAGERAARTGADFRSATAHAHEYRTLVLSGPDGESRAEALAVEAVS